MTKQSGEIYCFNEPPRRRDRQDLVAQLPMLDNADSRRSPDILSRFLG
ncbi:MAG: hypothetical protein DSM106950_35195 [Stigonema ocellatum SAG 48.90 = DSM 106950]|nr:hypothetical protein [Stigonema ocellatum SAG 48.90 = DSM 106950]